MAPMHEDPAGLLERGSQVAALDRVLAEAAAGQGSVVVIRGAPGIGKTRLAAELRRRAQDRGTRPLAARGGEFERDFAFGCVRQLYEPLLAADPDRRSRLLSGAAGLSESVFASTADAAGAPVDPAFGVLHGLYWLTANVAEDGPLLLVLDDAHWADPASLRYAAFLAPRLEGLRVVVALTVRPADPASGEDPLRAIALDPATTVLDLDPLSPGAVAQTVAARLGAQAGERLGAACHRATRGNPFLLGEVLRELERRGPGLASPETIAELAPDRVAAAVLARLERIGEPAPALARAVAGSGTRARPGGAARRRWTRRPPSRSPTPSATPTSSRPDGRCASPTRSCATRCSTTCAAAGVAHRRARRRSRRGGRPPRASRRTCSREPAGRRSRRRAPAAAAGASAAARRRPRCATSSAALAEPPPAACRPTCWPSSASPPGSSATHERSTGCGTRSTPAVDRPPLSTRRRRTARRSRSPAAPTRRSRSRTASCARRRPRARRALAWSRRRSVWRRSLRRPAGSCASACTRTCGRRSRVLTCRRRCWPTPRPSARPRAGRPRRRRARAAGDRARRRRRGGTRRAGPALTIGALVTAERLDEAERLAGDVIAIARARGTLRYYAAAVALRAWGRCRRGRLADVRADAELYPELPKPAVTDLMIAGAQIQALVDAGELGEATAVAERILAEPLDRTLTVYQRFAEGLAPLRLAQGDPRVRWTSRAAWRSGRRAPGRPTGRGSPGGATPPSRTRPSTSATTRWRWPRNRSCSRAASGRRDTSAPRWVSSASSAETSRICAKRADARTVAAARRASPRARRTRGRARSRWAARRGP